MEFIIVGLAALMIAALVKYISNRILSSEDRKTAERQNTIIQGAKQTARLAEQAEKEDFISRLEDFGIKIVEIGVYGAKLIGFQDGEKKDGSTAENSEMGKPLSQNDPGEHVVLNLRWKNIGKGPIRCATFAVAFLSPDGKVILPDALDSDPWIQKFGCAAAAKFTGLFRQGQGRMQKDMRNPFLLYRAPVGKAVILGVRVEYDSGDIREKTVF